MSLSWFMPFLLIPNGLAVGIVGTHAAITDKAAVLYVSATRVKPIKAAVALILVSHKQFPGLSSPLFVSWPAPVGFGPH